MNTKFNKNKMQERFKSCVESFSHNIKGLSPRASSNMLDHIRIELYGDRAPISNFGSVSVVDSRTLSIQVWDTAAVSPIAKAIQASGICGSPATSDSVIRVPLPPITEDRRKEMAGMVKKSSEEAKVALRNVRRDIMDDIKADEKNKLISEDEKKRLETEVQKSVDDFTKQIDKVAEEKTNELLKI